MEAQKGQQTAAAASVERDEQSSCGRREKKKDQEETSLLKDLKDQFDGFIHTSMDQHISCFKNTINKMFGMSKVDDIKSGGDDAKVPH